MKILSKVVLASFAAFMLASCASSKAAVEEGAEAVEETVIEEAGEAVEEAAEAVQDSIGYQK